MKAPGCLNRIPVRYVFTLLAFFGFVFNYSLRININLVITAMVNHTALNDTTDQNNKPVSWPQLNLPQ